MTHPQSPASPLPQAAPTPPVDAVLGEPVAWRYRCLIDRHITGEPRPGEIKIGDWWGKIGSWVVAADPSPYSGRPGFEKEPLYLAAPVASCAVQAEPTMDDAIAAGDGALHGAIDHWQRRALAAEAARDADETNKVLADNYLRLTATAEPDMRAICERLGFDPTNHHNAAKCPYCQPDSTRAASLAPMEDTRLLDWIERKVCDVSRLGDSARTLRISWNNGADSVFVGPHYNATWREAIHAAIAASPAGAEGVPK